MDGSIIMTKTTNIIPKTIIRLKLPFNHTKETTMDHIRMVTIIITIPITTTTGTIGIGVTGTMIGIITMEIDGGKKRIGYEKGVIGFCGKLG